MAVVRVVATGVYALSVRAIVGEDRVPEDDPWSTACCHTRVLGIYNGKRQSGKRSQDGLHDVKYERGAGVWEMLKVRHCEHLGENGSK
jgi:hypothetical protein